MQWTDHFKILNSQVFEAYGLKCSQPVADAESADYLAYSFRLDRKTVLFRQAKITPTKNGQFVTVWKRNGNGPIQPFDKSDKVDLIIVAVVMNQRYGHFVFPKAVLVKKDIFSVDGKNGKRAFRVYPPWDTAESKQAQKAQEWQLDFFIELAKDKVADRDKLRSLYLD